MQQWRYYYVACPLGTNCCCEYVEKNQEYLREPIKNFSNFRSSGCLFEQGDPSFFQ